ncbi:hypothetical protein FHU37_001708 [Allostreptomyces psammosilenae]|uniref:Uncharacterized protein n=2 Tax=Allostreptomyces psammosilenae TaxID=1892865 RepID=A0A852ZSG2_9ACTN|nr:hypothetical protein [Allostreptomyces psammosilenae]NYI04765.1 hypothetical protein [Allostreptomyces psammosilenae]
MISSQVREHICLIARTFPADPADWKISAFSTWSLTKLAEHLAPLRYFALNGTDHRSHGAQNAAIGAYVRTWTEYPAKAA